MPDRSDALLAGLTDEQRRAVNIDATPLLVVAGAGSGKTRVLTRRIAWHAREGALDPRRAMAVTFTRKAAGELASRLRDLGVRGQVTTGTFHALALAQLRQRRLERGREPPRLLDRKARLLGPLLGPGRAAEAAAVAREIEWAKARLVTPGEYTASAEHAGRRVSISWSEVASVYERYERTRRRRRLVDFDDLLTECAADIEGHREVAEAVRWRFQHFFVDEIQDVSPAQYRLLRAWLGDRRAICAVGDDQQSIYGFGGADSRYVTEFGRYFGEPAVVVRLTANFRSSPQILAAARSALPGRAPPLEAVAPDGPEPELTAYPTDGDEAAGVARQVLQLHDDGAPWSSVAVLARTNRQCLLVHRELERAAIPARIRGGRPFLDRPPVTAAVDILRAAAARAPGAPFGALLADLEELLAEVPGHERPEIRALMEMGAEYTGFDGPVAGLDGFVAYVATVARHDDPIAGSDAVNLLTFHRAKGLEWPVVFVVGLEAGFVPIATARTADTLDEERRLLHVALSRAGRALRLSWARRRAFGERVVDRRPSPWLDAITPHTSRRDQPEPTAGGATPVGRAALRAVAARLHVADPEPDHGELLLGALLEWRRRRARAARVPEAAVLDDATVRAIARVRPSDREALGAMPGIGASRLDRYAPEILDLVAATVGR